MLNLIFVFYLVFRGSYIRGGLYSGFYGISCIVMLCHRIVLHYATLSISPHQISIILCDFILIFYEVFLIPRCQFLRFFEVIHKGRPADPEEGGSAESGRSITIRVWFYCFIRTQRGERGSRDPGFSRTSFVNGPYMTSCFARLLKIAENRYFRNW